MKRMKRRREKSNSAKTPFFLSLSLSSSSRSLFFVWGKRERERRKKQGKKKGALSSLRARLLLTHSHTIIISRVFGGFDPQTHNKIKEKRERSAKKKKKKKAKDRDRERERRPKSRKERFFGSPRSLGFSFSSHRAVYPLLQTARANALSLSFFKKNESVLSNERERARHGEW